MSEEILSGEFEKTAVGDSSAGGAVRRQPPTAHRDEIDGAQFAALLQCFDADRERAWGIYAGVRERLARFFADKNCRTPFECADDTLDRTARRLAQGAHITTGDPYGYILGIAYNVLREYWKSRERKTIELDALAPAHHPSHDPVDELNEREERAAREHRLDCLNKCLAQLPPEQSAFLNAYHTGAGGGERIEGRRRLAAELGVELNALRIRACRVRDRLEKCLRACLARSGGGEV